MLKMKKLNSAHSYHKFRKHGLWLHKNPLSIPPQSVWKTDDPAIRRLTTLPYPYLVFYEVTESEIIVHAVRHAARDPSRMPGSSS